MPHPLLPKKPRRRAFSLVEVVLALGVVAAAVLVLIGILGTTFTSAREVAMQHRAVNAVSLLSGALQNASGIKGAPTTSDGTPAFERVYRLLQPKSDGTQFIDFFVYQKSQEKTPSVPVVYYAASGNFTMAESMGAEHEGIDRSTVFRLRVRVSAMLKDKLYELDPATFEPKAGVKWSVGTPLPSSVDNYALAYLPLSVELYPHDFTEATNPGTAANVDPATAKVLPLITAPVVLNR